MERSVEVLAVILFGVIGLSHIVQPKAWVDYFILLRGKGEAGAFVDGFLHLPLAGFIIAFHNVWSGIPAVLTVLGWCFLIKSVLRFCLPKLGVRMMGRVSLSGPGNSRRPAPPWWRSPASLVTACIGASGDTPVFGVQSPGSRPAVYRPIFSLRAGPKTED